MEADETDIPIAATSELTPTPTEESIEIDERPLATGEVNKNPDLVLWTDQEYLVAGEELTLNIELSEITNKGDLVIEASKGLSPVGEYATEFSAEKSTLSVASSQQTTLTWQSDSDSEGPYYFYVKVMDGETIVAENLLGLDQAVRGSATPQGGAVKWENKGVSVTLPEGAVDQDVDLIIRQAIANPIAPYSLSGHSIILKAETSDGVELDKFDQEILLEIAYDQELYDGNESTLLIHYYNEARGVWEIVPTERDMENNLLRAEIDHFSEWDLVPGSWEAARLPSLGNFDAADYIGAATFNMPIELPPGPGGFQPELNLNYNSSTVDGVNLYTQASWAGMGWNMQIGAIVRDQHGTADYTIDDTFILDFGDSGGLLIQETTDPAANIVRYHLQDEEFRRVEYHKAEDSWIVWDKYGTQYIFGGRYNANLELLNDAESSADYPAGCDGTHAKQTTWYWGLKQILNKYTESINIEWLRAGRSMPNYCGAGTTAHLFYDTKPTMIMYPGNQYRVLLEATNNRTDHPADWHIGVTFYTTRNLDTIRVQEYRGGQWVDAWHYDLVYAQDKAASNPSYSNYVFPAYEWMAGEAAGPWQHTLTLVEVKKCYGQGGCDPAYSFEYGDGMHLTAAENGQGGED